MRSAKQHRSTSERRPRNPVLRGIDTVLRLLGFGKRTINVATMPPPLKILVCHGAHLGDVVLATAVLPVLKDAFPGAQIGMVVGSWSRVVIAGHPLVEWVHSVDHWIQNRLRVAFWKRAWRHLVTHFRALKEIRRIKYDVALDLYPTFGNHVLLIWQADIPMRIAYSSGGFGPLLTHAANWKDLDRSVVDYHADLLRMLGVSETSLRLLKPCLPPVPDISIRERIDEISSDGFFLLHAGTGLPAKEWSLEAWRGVARRLALRGFSLVFTGYGEREHRQIQAIVDGLPRCHNLSGRLAWQESVSIIKQARMVITVDSVTAHIAAVFGTPCVVIGNGISNPAHWQPRSRNAVWLMKPVPCAPCYLKEGCEGRECILDVHVEDVIRAVDHFCEQGRSQESANTQERWPS